MENLLEITLLALVAGGVVLNFRRRIQKQQHCDCGCDKCDTGVKIGEALESRAKP